MTLEGSNVAVDLAEAIRNPDNVLGFDGLWSTNLLQPSSLPQGVANQIAIGLGTFGQDYWDWGHYGFIPPPATLAFQVDYFRALFGFSTP